MFQLTFLLIDLDGAGTFDDSPDRALPAPAGPRGAPRPEHIRAAQQPPTLRTTGHVLDVLQQVCHCKMNANSTIKWVNLFVLVMAHLHTHKSGLEC